MRKFLKPAEEYLYGILRIVAGFLFLCHGLQKVFGVLGGPGIGMLIEKGNGLAVAAGIIELVGGLLIMVGLFTSWAAFLCSGTMAVAYHIAHFSLAQPLPVLNGGELAAVYAFLFLFMAAKGDGKLSLGPKLKLGGN